MAHKDFEDLKPCPFCGSNADPEVWGPCDSRPGPKCEGCGATATSIETWNQRIATESHDIFPLGLSPAQAFEHHVANPNLFRTLATRLEEYSIFAKFAGFPMEEGEIGPDCARSSLLLRAMANVVEESRE